MPKKLNSGPVPAFRLITFPKLSHQSPKLNFSAANIYVYYINIDLPPGHKEQRAELSQGNKHNIGLFDFRDKDSFLSVSPI